MDVRAVVERHNRRALVTGLGLLALSALLWFLTYWAFKLFVIIVIWPRAERWDIELSPAAVSWMALALAGALVIECLREGKTLYDREAYANSVFLEGVTDVEQEFVVRRVLAMPESGYHQVAELLLAAPRWTARALDALRSRTTLSESMLDHVQGIVDELAAKDWVPLEPYAPDGKALAQLYLLGMLRLRVRKGERQIRLSGEPAGL